LNISSTVSCVFWVLWDGMGPKVVSKYRLMARRILSSLPRILELYAHYGQYLQRSMTYFEPHKPFIDTFTKLSEFFLERQLFRFDFFHLILFTIIEGTIQSRGYGWLCDMEGLVRSGEMQDAI
jgi:hypothetical protein